MRAGESDVIEVGEQFALGHFSSALCATMRSRSRRAPEQPSIDIG
jgi:hypothetical protein